MDGKDIKGRGPECLEGLRGECYFRVREAQKAERPGGMLRFKI